MKYLNYLPMMAVTTLLTVVNAANPVSITAAPEKSSKKSSPKKTSPVKAVNNVTCPVMDAAIGSMGEGVTVTHKGYAVKLCCASCTSKFNQNPDSYLQAALGTSQTSDSSGASASGGTAAGLASGSKTAKKEGKSKPSTVQTVNNANCPVAGSPIGSMGAGTSVTHKGYKVSLCCGGCTGKFNENPDAYLQAALSDSKR